jgi:hypothetical protein
MRVSLLPLSKDLSRQNKPALLPFLTKRTGKRARLRPEPRENPKYHDYLRIIFARKRKQRSYDFLPLFRYDLMTCTHQDSPNKNSTPSHPPHTQNNITSTQTKPSIPPSPSTSSSTMLLNHVITHQAFHEITNFIRDNGNNWDKFCSNTTRSVRKAKKPPPPQHKVLKHKTAKTKGRLAPEPLLQASPHRFVLFPIQHNDIWQMYKKAEASFCTAKEIELSANATDWKRLSPAEQHFITRVLAFFAASDGIVNENLSTNFATEVTTPEAQCFYGFQIAVKNIQGNVLASDQHVCQGSN